MTTADDSAVPIACTLGANDMRLRFERIRELSARALLGHTQQGRTLHLHFAPEARAEVRALVDEERVCCAFLSLELTEAADGVRLVVTAPAEAGEFGALLFSHFAPQPSTARPVAPSAGARCECGLR